MGDFLLYSLRLFWYPTPTAADLDQTRSDNALPLAVAVHGAELVHYCNVIRTDEISLSHFFYILCQHSMHYGNVIVLIIRIGRPILSCPLKRAGSQYFMYATQH